MFLLSSGDLIDLLGQHNLLAADQLAQLPELIQSRSSDGRALAKVLVHRGWLSAYQAQVLVTGKVAELSLGPYRILDLLGQGGLSKVYKAHHAELGWSVALKVIRPEVLTSQEGRNQFLQEMEAMARLEHPNIVQFCDVDQAGDLFYYAMEYVEGTDLGKLVHYSGPLPPFLACDFIRQVALGLQHAHERNLVHRDIKPVNLYLTVAGGGGENSESGQSSPPLRSGLASSGLASTEGVQAPLIKILDWGLASVRPPGQKLEENQGRCLLGTVDYLAPEQALNPDAANIRSDIYSLGCTLYFLLSGQVPFPEGSLEDKLHCHQEEEPAPLTSFRKDLPFGLTGILKRMMAKNPEDRYRTPDALALSLAPLARPPRNMRPDALDKYLRAARLSGAGGNPSLSSFTLSQRSVARLNPGQTLNHLPETSLSFSGLAPRSPDKEGK